MQGQEELNWQTGSACGGENGRLLGMQDRD